MIFLLADDSHEISIPYFCRKLGKMTQKLSSAAVVIGAFRDIFLQADYSHKIKYQALYDLLKKQLYLKMLSAKF